MGVRERGSRRDGGERRDGGDGEGQAESHECSFHLTSSVNGAVTTRPPTLVWRNRRHVPGAGTSTPTVSRPGFDEVPTTCAPPSVEVQPLAPGAQTWVWK